MEINKTQKNWFAYSIGIILCLIIRLLPFRPPNIEPILATQMPFAKAFGGLPAFFFGFVSIILYDSITNTMGKWTLITSLTYGAIGALGGAYFMNKKSTALNYTIYAIIGTIIFDGITGLTVGPLFFGQSLRVAFTGQIPFTLMHLLGNVSFAVVLSPAVYYLIIKNKKIDHFYTSFFLKPTSIQ